MRVEGAFNIGVIIDGYRETQALNLRLIKEMAVGGALVMQPVARVAAMVLEEALIDETPVWTGTLQASQGIVLEEESNMARLFTMPDIQNPITGGMSAQYVYQVVERKPFYSWAVKAIERNVEETALEGVEMVLADLSNKMGNPTGDLRFDFEGFL